MALYRKYRPASFAEVVGQEHVTEPLSIALDNGRINHAYLFSGPRGCGKTSSARILARSLNCVQGPTSTPCGVCESCVSLAPGGAGNLDVTELDAATHNGVEDMRELRDRAYYAPADSRYRVFIIDEAHMITKDGFNALLKVVEEPPEHLIFIFATTEPEKMLATIRSRTHNYPFRLLTPPTMRGLLEKVVAEEGKQVADEVYPLVVRAGGGSPRDSLSVLDQLIAGSGPEGVTYQRALMLLGVTDVALIDRAIDALSDQDQAGLFSVVDEVIDAGYDPRRFATDLLDRLRDLLIIKAVPDAFGRGLVDAPAGMQEVLAAQAEAMGQATLTRCAGLVNEGLDHMRGATAPRLLLEILMARMALPGAGMTVEALAQRVEALEQGRAGAPAVGQDGRGSGGRRYERPSRRNKAAEAAGSGAEGGEKEHIAATEAAPAVRQDRAEDPAIAQAREAREIMERRRKRAAGHAHGQQTAQQHEVPQGAEQKEQAEQQPTAQQPQRAGGAEAPYEQQEPSQTTPTELQNVWTKILEQVKQDDLSAWIAARNAWVAPEQPKANELHIHHHTGALANVVNSGARAAAFAAAAAKVTGRELAVVASVGVAAPTGAKSAATPAASSEPATAVAPAASVAPAVPAEPQVAEPAPQNSPAARPSPGASALERAKAMAEARPTTRANAPTQPHRQAPPQDKSATGWRARAERRAANANPDNGFDGVPLPPEPPEDPDWAPGQEEVVASTRREEDDILEQIAEGPGERDHRQPLDIAGELVEKHLGGQRIV